MSKNKIVQRCGKAVSKPEDPMHYMADPLIQLSCEYATCSKECACYWQLQWSRCVLPIFGESCLLDHRQVRALDSLVSYSRNNNKSQVNRCSVVSALGVLKYHLRVAWDLFLLQRWNQEDPSWSLKTDCQRMLKAKASFKQISSHPAWSVRTWTYLDHHEMKCGHWNYSSILG